MDARLLRRVACPATMQTIAAGASARRLWTAAAGRTLSHTSPLLSPSSPSPLIPTAAGLVPSESCPAGRRYQSSANRTKRALNIPPHASLAASGNFRANKHATGVAGAAAGEIAALGTIISSPSPSGQSSSTTLLYNPPASAPSVYQTPFKFLPKSDPRRRSNLTSFFSRPTSTSSSTTLAPELAHRSYTPPEQKYHLTEADVAEIRRLRAEDPVEWSVLRLAKEYKCSPIFVMLAVRSSAEHRKAKKEQLAAVQKRWGPIRTKARTERAKRRELLYNGGL